MGDGGEQRHHGGDLQRGHVLRNHALISSPTVLACRQVANGSAKPAQVTLGSVRR